MNPSTNQEFISEDQAAEQATVKYLNERYPNMSPEMANLWARAITLEEQENERWRNKKAEMSPQLEETVETARKKANDLLKKGKENMIRRGYKESLEKNDMFEALAFQDDADKLGIDLSDILESTDTELDREALKSGLLPLNCIS